MEPAPPTMPQWNHATHRTPAPAPAPHPWGSRFRCTHNGPQTIGTFKQRNGLAVYRQICDTCGHDGQNLAYKKLSAKQKAEARPMRPGAWIKAIRDAWWAKRRVTYEEYLQSPDWRLKRSEVLKRDNNNCFFCPALASQVHHLRYDNLGEESLDDLISVCGPCHKIEHARGYDYVPRGAFPTRDGKLVPSKCASGPLTPFEITHIESSSCAHVLRDPTQPDSYFLIDSHEQALGADELRKMYNLKED